MKNRFLYYQKIATTPAQKGMRAAQESRAEQISFAMKIMRQMSFCKTNAS